MIRILSALPLLESGEGKKTVNTSEEKSMLTYAEARLALGILATYGLKHPQPQDIKRLDFNKVDRLPPEKKRVVILFLTKELNHIQV